MSIRIDVGFKKRKVAKDLILFASRNARTNSAFQPSKFCQLRFGGFLGKNKIIAS